MTSTRFQSDGPLPPPVLVERDERFARLLRELASADEIAFDTEADSFFSYQERVCLIQITANDVDYVVDPFQVDVSGLGSILADPNKTKVFHDGEYDVLILKRDYGFAFAGLFDTRVAAAALGEATPGLAAVVLDHFGVELDKSQQRSDWSRRPLTEQQIDYARQDTRYLLPLMHRLRERLEETGRTRVVDGECRRLEALEPNAREFDPDEFIRIKGTRNLDPRQMRAMRELFVWRDREARERDVPPFKVLGNHFMLDVARSRPKSLHALQSIPSISPKIARRHGAALLEVVREAEALEPIRRTPRLPPKDGTGALDEAQFELHERLKTWRKERAAKEGYDASLVLNRHPMVRIAIARPKTLDELARVDGVLDWQLEDFGEEIIGTVRAFDEDLADGRIELGRRRKRRG